MTRTIDLRSRRIAMNHMGYHRGVHMWAWHTGSIWNWTYGEFDGVGSASTKEEARRMAKKVINDLFDREDKVDRLLHDAEHAESGAQFAAVMNDEAAVRRLCKKRDRLIAKAQEIDPACEAPAWKEHEKWKARS